MRIIIFDCFRPFTEDSRKLFPSSLCQKMQELGHQVELFRLPYHPYHLELVQQMLAFRLLDVAENADKVIAFKAPAHAVNHPGKIIWLSQFYRPFYDLWDTPFGLLKTAQTQLKRDEQLCADHLYLSEAKRIFCSSKYVQDQLESVHGISSERMYFPHPEADSFHASQGTDYFFSMGALKQEKRHDLLIKSMKLVHSDAKLIIAGCEENKEWLEHLLDIIKVENLSDKVSVLNRWLSPKEKFDCYANAIACVQVPLLENACCHDGMEAFYAKKPLISCEDSGSLLEIIDHDRNGFILPPEPKAIAECFDTLFTHRNTARNFGEAGYEKAQSMKTGWQDCIERLLQ